MAAGAARAKARPAPANRARASRNSSARNLRPVARTRIAQESDRSYGMNWWAKTESNCRHGDFQWDLAECQCNKISHLRRLCQ